MITIYTFTFQNCWVIIALLLLLLMLLHTCISKSIKKIIKHFPFSVCTERGIYVIGFTFPVVPKGTFLSALFLNNVSMILTLSL